MVEDVETYVGTRRRDSRTPNQFLLNKFVGEFPGESSSATVLAWKRFSGMVVPARRTAIVGRFRLSGLQYREVVRHGGVYGIDSIDQQSTSKGMARQRDMSRAFTKAFVPPLSRWATGNPASGFPRSHPPSTLESGASLHLKLSLELGLRMILSPELVDEILVHLRHDKQALRKCSLVSKLWTYPSQKLLTPASSSPIRHTENGEKLHPQRVRSCCDTLIYVACSNPFTTSMRVISSHFITSTMSG